MKIIIAGAIVALSTFAAAAADYATTQSLCSGGHRTTDDDRTLSVGSGTVSVGSMNCERAGKKRELGGGWFTADWSCSVEGEPIEEPISFELRVSHDAVDIRTDGQVTRYMRCG